MATEKQKKAIAILAENGGNVSKAMREAGYSPISAATPKKLTTSQAFQEFMIKSGITDEKLANVLKDGLEANKTIVMGKESSESFVDIQPDHPTRHKFLETALKIKGIGRDADASGNTFIFNKGDLVRKKYVKD
jgi:hypothetical protein